MFNFELLNEEQWHQTTDPEWTEEFLDGNITTLCVSDLCLGSISGTLVVNWVEIKDDHVSFYYDTEAGDETDVTISTRFKSLRWTQSDKLYGDDYVAAVMKFDDREVRLVSLFESFPPPGFYLPDA